MMPAWLVGALVVGALVLIARRPSSAAPSIRVSGPLALVGDSIAVGLAAPLGRLVRALGAEFFWDAEVGTNARQWRSRIDSALARRPRTVLVNLGGNDAASPVLTAEFASNMRAIVGKIRAAGAQPILLKPPSRPSPSFAVIQQGLRSTGAVVLAPSPAIPRAPDGVHFTAAGYQAHAEDISEALTVT